MCDILLVCSPRDRQSYFSSKVINTHPRFLSRGLSYWVSMVTFFFFFHLDLNRGPNGHFLRKNFLKKSGETSRGARIETSRNQSVCRSIILMGNSYELYKRDGNACSPFIPWYDFVNFHYLENPLFCVVHEAMM